MKTTLKTVLCLTVMAWTLIGIGSASTLASGTVPFGFTGVSTSPPGALVANTHFTIAVVAASSDGTGSFACPSTTCVLAGSAASFSPDPFIGNALGGLVLTFGLGGRYTYLAVTQDPPALTSGGAGETFDNIVTNGTFTDSGGDFTSAAASLILTFDQTCVGNGCSISGAATFATPPSETTFSPEPTMLFLTGGALLGVGLLRRRPARA